ncbi:hypothetical protein KUTeg_001847, partial [Tegillarca granosa]
MGYTNSRSGVGVIFHLFSHYSCFIRIPFWKIWREIFGCNTDDFDGNFKHDDTILCSYSSIHRHGTAGVKRNMCEIL